MSDEQWDYESRYETTTRTDGGAFDQVLAMSQGTINENFAKLYEIYPELHTIYYDKPGIGVFEAQIKAPQIMIPGANKPSANLQDVLFGLKCVSMLSALTYYVY
jgi:hypothetical protein